MSVSPTLSPTLSPASPSSPRSVASPWPNTKLAKIPRNTPCIKCRKSRIRCIWLEGTGMCAACLSRGLFCPGPQRVNAMKCALCHHSKVRCEWKPDDPNVCIRCFRLGKNCPGVRAMAVLEYGHEEKSFRIQAKEAPPPQVEPTSPSETKLFTTQLTLSLTYHCIQTCCKNHHVIFGVGDPSLYMDYFYPSRNQTRRSLKSAPYEEVLASLIIFAGATLSNHSALTGNNCAPEFPSLFSPQYTLKSPTTFPLLSPRRSAAISSLSNTVSNTTSSFLKLPRASVDSTIEHLSLIRLVLSKATAVDFEWQAEACRSALRQGLSSLKACSNEKREDLLPLVKHFAFKAIINAATSGRRGDLPLSQSEFDLIFDNPSPFIVPTAAEISSFVYNPCPHGTFLEFVWTRTCRDEYSRIARTFFNLIRPQSNTSLKTIWNSVDDFVASKEELFRNLSYQRSLIYEDHSGRAAMRYSAIVRSFLAYEANYWRLAMIARSYLESSSNDRQAVRSRWRSVIPGVAADVELLLSLPILLTRKMEILNHQIALLLQFPAEELARDFLLLSSKAREALLQGIKASALIVKGHTALQLDAVVDLLHATDRESIEFATSGSNDLAPSIHVTSAVLEVLRASEEAPVTSLFVLVVVPIEGD